jgi:hypothetical protein
MATEIQREEKTKHRPWTLIHINNAKAHTSKSNLGIMEELHLKCIVHPPLSSDIASSDFSLWVAERRVRFSMS